MLPRSILESFPGLEGLPLGVSHRWTSVKEYTGFDGMAVCISLFQWLTLNSSVLVLESIPGLIKSPGNRRPAYSAIEFATRSRSKSPIVTAIDARFEVTSCYRLVFVLTRYFSTIT